MTRMTILILLLQLLGFNCKNKPPVTPAPTPAPFSAAVFPETIDVLALGDSYTKGESVVWAQNFPNQLADSLRAEGRSVAGVRVIAQTGWRTDQLQSAIKNAGDLTDSTFSLVTLCIGVNNQYQNANFETYKTQFEQLLQTAIQRAGGRKEHVVVVSIPDWAYTPYGQNFSAGPAVISEKIDRYNAANRTISEQYGVVWVNVTDVSRKGLSQPDLVASDGLHPSAQQYREWVKLLLPVVRNALKQ